MTPHLHGKVALVTGGSRGIGLAVASAFLHAGADVAIVARDEHRLAAATEQLARTGGGTVRGYNANAGKPEDVTRSVAQVMSDLGRLDILVNNVATNPYYGPVVGLDLPRALKTTQVNMMGPILWIQQAWEVWMRGHGGAIVNMASIGPFIVEHGAGFYAATKAALVQLTRQFAAELGPTVRVNAVAPGLIRTEMSRRLWEGREEDVASALPLGRLGTPDDVAQATLFLASNAASWITGHTLVVDGGALVTPPAGLVTPAPTAGGQSA